VPSGRSSPPHDTFFIGGDDMGIGAAEHELRWDSFAYPSTFSNGILAALPIPFVN